MDPYNNLLITDYYAFTADNLLCAQVRSDEVNSDYGRLFNFSCSSQIDNIVKSKKLDSLNLSDGYFEDLPSKKDEKLTEKEEIPFQKTPIKSNDASEEFGQLNLLTIYLNCKLSPYGKVRFKGKRISLKDCSKRETFWPLDFEVYSYHEEVYVIAQYWGNNYFHKIVEDLPRLVLFIKLLKVNPQIKILSADRSKRTRELLEVLGLDSSRLVTGWVRAKVAYVPRSTECGKANFLEAQVTNKIFRNHIATNFFAAPPTPSKIILIQRSGSRRLLEHAQVVEALREVAAKHKLELHVFSDNPSPSLKDTMMLFAEAVAVVAPHGAGLSNLLFSAPGTLVLEGILKSPNVNLCYQRLAFVLGMRWYGMTSQDHGLNFVSLKADLIAKNIDYLLNKTRKVELSSS